MIARRGGKFDSAMGRVVLENDLELVTFTLDGHLLHTHKTNFGQRHSLNIWPDFESAKKAFESGPINWGPLEQ
jgi:hypothetical protein